MMKAVITQTNTTKCSDRLQSRSIIYIGKSPLDNVVDKWFTDNEIIDLSFKCKTWSNVARLATKATSPLLKQLFPEALSITFSRKAGCKCGCSPGYIMKHEPNQYGRNFWVDIEGTPEEIEQFSVGVNCARLRHDLSKEIESQTVAA